MTTSCFVAARENWPRNRWISPFGIRPSRAETSLILTASFFDRRSLTTRSKVFRVPNASTDAHALLEAQHRGHPTTRPGPPGGFRAHFGLQRLFLRNG